MPTRKLRPFVEVLNLVNSLTDEQRADLLDYLRGSQPKKERKASKKPEKVEKPPRALALAEQSEKPQKVDICVTCGNEEAFIDHKPESEVYHKFRTSLKQKAATESK